MIRANIIAALLFAVAAAGPASSQAARPAPAAATAASNVPRADYITTMDTEFRKMDADKNGRLTRPEIEAFERITALGRARARAQARFAELDTDRNGQISPAEFARLVTGVPAVDGRPLIAKLDGNKDGQISLIEHRAGKLSYFDQIDSDKDGVVSVAEMKAAGVIK